MVPRSYEAVLGSIRVNIPYPTREDLLMANMGHLGKANKMIIDEDFSGKNSDFPTNESISDYLDFDVNAEAATLYLDADEEHLKISTNSLHGLLRAVIELNNLLSTPLTGEDVEEFRMANKVFSTKSYNKSEEIDENLECVKLMAGVLDFTIELENKEFNKFEVSGDLLELYSEIPSNKEIEEVVSFQLINSPHLDDIEFDSESDCFIASAYSVEAIIDLLTCMHELAGLNFNSDDKELLKKKIKNVL